MLDRLDAIPWARLTHAYGPASDVPQHLRDLTSADDEVREEALRALATTIYHQGTLYEATASAVPFLVALAGDSQLTGRLEILNLIACIAQGSSFVYGPSMQPAAEQLERERKWVADAKAAVAEAESQLEILTGDPDEAVRAAAVRLVKIIRQQ